MLKIYGIKNCDTVKKALKWLKENNIAHEFIDFKKSPPSTELIQQWCKQLDWELLLNRRGTTWRQLDEAQKTNVDQAKAIKLMAAQPSMIKRPVWQHDDNAYLGFTDEVKALLSS
ncbi:MAG: arsenate reductase [Coxiellaceae bacterium]|nr:arsenate reductase [Coxiellaceae bacterium]